MRVTHLYHSGFMIELPTCTLVFDLFDRDLPSVPQECPLVVFVSHIHYDHFDTRIWDLRNHYDNVTYVLDSAVAAQAPADARVIAVQPHHTYDISLPCAAQQLASTSQHLVNASQQLPDEQPETLTVYTLESNDEGVAFLIKAASAQKKLYFSGDLNSWQWDRPEEKNRASDEFFRTELHKAVKAFPHCVPLDAAFVPLDPRLKDPARGIASFVDVIDTHSIFPMHYRDSAAKAKTYLHDSRLAPIAKHIHFDDIYEA